MYKLIALDLDGTLLNSGLQLSDRNAAALAEAMARGVEVVIATSRWYGLAMRTAEGLGITTPLICSNGALVRRPDRRADLLHLPLDDVLAREVTAMGDENRWEMFTTIGDATYMKGRPGVATDQLPGGLRAAERQSDHIGEGPAICVLVFGQPAVDAIEARYGSGGDGRARFSFNRPEKLPAYVVLTHPEAEKGRALDLVCRELGVAPTEAVAMGDSESDLGMLRHAGLGIAMHNSPDIVKRAAIHIAPSNDDDGVAWAVRKFVI